MAKKKNQSTYICTDCGNELPYWMGQCSFCGAWNTIVEQKIQNLPENEDTRRRTSTGGKASRLSDCSSENYARIDSGIKELNRVLGGGIVPGSVTLISGEPGIGKSTLILETANIIANSKSCVLYVTGEESPEQVKLRADRVCGNISDNLYILSETSVEIILDVCKELNPKFVIIDSIQTMYQQSSESVAGTLSQIRDCTNALITYAKASKTPIFIVAHVTKSGDLAGPKTMEHMVDVVLSFTGERDRDLRILRSYKNRFGTTDEIGAFRMGEVGMIEVGDLSGSLIENMESEEGSCISAIYEGSRPIFFEVQALVSRANVGFAKRNAIGINNNRLSMILAILEKKAGISLLDYDVYVNVVGDVSNNNAGTDLAVAMAIYSSFYQKTYKGKNVAIGELGLTGKLRRIPNAEKIVLEAKRLGYENILIPKANLSKISGSEKISVADSIHIIGVDNIREALHTLKD